MKIHKSLTPERVAEIQAAQTLWREWAEREQAAAEKGRALFASAYTGFRVVKAFDLELETGEAHCPCCYKTTGNRNQYR